MNPLKVSLTSRPSLSVCLMCYNHAVTAAGSATATRRYSYEVLLNENDREEERLFKLWSQQSDRPQSPVGRKCTPSEVEAREKLLLKRTLSPSSPTSMARDMLKDDSKRKQAW